MTEEEFKKFYDILINSRVDSYDLPINGQGNVIINMLVNVLYNTLTLLKEKSIFSEEDLSKMLKPNSFIDISIPLYEKIDETVSVETNIKYLMHNVHGKKLEDTLGANLQIEGEKDPYGIL